MYHRANCLYCLNKISWDEMAEFDLPTMINGVLKATGQSSLYYVGHSQGTTMMFSRLSTEPTFARKVLMTES